MAEVEVGAEVEVEEEVEAEVEEGQAETPHNPNKSSSRAKMKELWDNFPKYSMGTAQKQKPSWKKSKATSGSTPTLMGSTPL